MAANRAHVIVFAASLAFSALSESSTFLRLRGAQPANETSLEEDGVMAEIDEFLAKNLTADDFLPPGASAKMAASVKNVVNVARVAADKQEPLAMSSASKKEDRAGATKVAPRTGRLQTKTIASMPKPATKVLVAQRKEEIEVAQAAETDAGDSNADSEVDDKAESKDVESGEDGVTSEETNGADASSSEESENSEASEDGQGSEETNNDEDDNGMSLLQTGDVDDDSDETDEVEEDGSDDAVEEVDSTASDEEDEDAEDMEVHEDAEDMEANEAQEDNSDEADEGDSSADVTDDLEDEGAQDVIDAEIEAGADVDEESIVESEESEQDETESTTADEA